MAEPYVIKMPQLSDTMTEGVIVSWEKNIGDAVKRGDIVATVETDKAVMDVEVFRDGYLSGPIAPVDAVVPVTHPIAYLVESRSDVDASEARPVAAAAKAQVPAAAASQPSTPAAAAPAAAGAAPAPRPQGTRASPLARRLAAQLGTDIDRLSGSGPGGVVTAADIQRAPAPFEMAVPGNGRPMKSMEKAIARAMASSISMPTFRVTVHIHLESLMAAARSAGVSVTVAIAKACAEAIKKNPRINWCYQPVDKLVERSTIDIGMAVAADGGGLVVPVLRHCESKSLEELNEAWGGLVERARKRRLAPEEYANPTFMVSNMGMLGVSYFDAIPTPGTAAILAIRPIDGRPASWRLSASRRQAARCPSAPSACPAPPTSTTST